MGDVPSVLVVALLLLVAGLGIAVAVLRRQRDTARADAGDDLAGRAVVVVDVRNADDLAARRTQLARALSFVAPRATRSLVHREVVRRIKDQLAAEGVLAEVRVRRWPGPRSMPEQPGHGAQSPTSESVTDIGASTTSDSA